MLVSVVIPVYNAEKYLKRCVESVLEQTHQDVQVILVNDGSKDNSPQICDEYAQKDKRVQVIHQENKGLSEARNAGFKVAKGQFLLFLDSDDFWIYNDGLETLLSNPVVSKDDFIYMEFNRCRYVPSKDCYFNFPIFPEKLTEVCDVLTVVHELVTHGMFPMSACTKLLNREFLVREGISFIPGLLSEDTPWFMDILRKAKGSISYMNYYLYGNRAEVLTSITSTFSGKKIDDILYIIDTESKNTKESFLPEDTKSEMMSSLAYKYTLLMIQYFTNKNKVDKAYRNKMKDHEWILKYDIHPKVKKVNMLKRYLGGYLSSYILSKYMKNKDSIKLKLKN